MRAKFWTLPLDSLSPREWEALCDGCGRCCLLKLEDPETGELAYTRVACRLFDHSSCRCGNYALRKSLVKGCILLSTRTLAEAAPWLPASCAYRRLHQGQGLPDWHPLLTGDPDSTHKAGISMALATVPEWEVAEEDLEDHIIEMEV